MSTVTCSDGELQWIATRGPGRRIEEPAIFGVAKLREGGLVLACPEGERQAMENCPRYVGRTLPAGLGADTGLAAPLLAAALDAWGELKLELGEAAVLTGEGELADVVALAAQWYGACPVIRLGADTPDRDGVEPFVIDPEEPESDMLRLSGLLADIPAVKCIDLTGRASTVDVLFEVLPPYFRMMLAGDRSELLTIDYYVNIHRKGAHVLARDLDPARTIRAAAVDGFGLDRAFRVLAAADLARSVQAMVNPSGPGTGR